MRRAPLRLPKSPAHARIPQTGIGRGRDPRSPRRPVPQTQQLAAGKLLRLRDRLPCPPALCAACGVPALLTYRNRDLPRAGIDKTVSPPKRKIRHLCTGSVDPGSRMDRDPGSLHEGSGGIHTPNDEGMYCDRAFTGTIGSGTDGKPFLIPAPRRRSPFCSVRSRRREGIPCGTT